MNNKLQLSKPDASIDFSHFESKFKALADQIRLHILYELTQKGSVSVQDLTAIIGMSQSKLSYHLKILLDAGLITRETKGTWSVYELNNAKVNRLISPELCCIFRVRATSICVDSIGHCISLQN